MDLLNSNTIESSDKIPRRILKNGRQPAKLPIPASVRHLKRMDHWRELIWRADYKFFFVLQPQVREMFRKIAFGMEREKRADLFKNFQLGLLQFWMKTGSVPRMQDFVTAVWSGNVFLFDVDLPGLPEKIPANHPALNSLKSLLIYQPCQDSKSTDLDRVLGAKKFTDFLGPTAPERPWNTTWVSEMKTVRKQASAELGEATVKGICSELGAGQPDKGDNRQ